ncbi:DUF4238 domain-containing protein [Ulvibacter antarcticus]|uniref:Uncharacterized protein DUF4238 n=1 Tax=Ulvibacter antarcticus TaxID=442714 RepID=A0A3L9YUV6_9FLAO|nr:DUF4238 domain-containing protein [Ulvibacter antarcticus]RMA64303.1 uncharacterized protein DUF4238 [Ulvibacter antarcticus]
MSQTVKNQHYIPKSYLKNFGYLVAEYTRPSGKVDKKYSIYNIEKGGEIKHNSTKKICKMDYLYDLPFADEEHKQFIEKAYDQKIDKHFPEVTSFIEDDKSLTLSNEMREMVLKCGLSLYFRTPKHVTLSDKENLIISRLPKDKQQKLYNEFKTKRLESHLENFDKLFNQKRGNGICINKAVGDWDFISGDNPVIIRAKSGQFEGVFEASNIIHIPFTPKYCITIMPDNVSKEIPILARYDYSNDHIMTINHDIEKHHEQYVFGTERALNDYLNESPIYKAPVLDNDPRVLDMKNRALAFQHFVNIAEKHGVISNQAKTVFLYYWHSLPGFRKDPNNIKLKVELGY